MTDAARPAGTTAPTVATTPPAVAATPSPAAPNVGIADAQLAGLTAQQAAAQAVGSAVVRGRGGATTASAMAADLDDLRGDAQLRAQMATYEAARPEAAAAFRADVERAVQQATSGDIGARMQAQLSALQALDGEVKDVRQRLDQASGVDAGALSTQLGQAEDERQLAQAQLQATTAAVAQARAAVGTGTTDAAGTTTSPTAAPTSSGSSDSTASLAAQLADQTRQVRDLQSQPGARGDALQLAQDRLVKLTAAYAQALASAGTASSGK